MDRIFRGGKEKTAVRSEDPLGQARGQALRISTLPSAEKMSKPERLKPLTDNEFFPSPELGLLRSGQRCARLSLPSGLTRGVPEPRRLARPQKPGAQTIPAKHEPLRNNRREDGTRFMDRRSRANRPAGRARTEVPCNRTRRHPVPSNVRQARWPARHGRKCPPSDRWRRGW